VSYANGPFKAAAGYLQINGSNSTTNTAGAVDLGESAANGTGGFQLGADVQRTAGAALSYGFGPVTAGFVYTHSQFQNTASFGATHGSMRFDNYEVNGKYTVTPALSLGAAYTYTNAHVSGTSSFGSDPKWNQVNLQAVYALSLRTDVYAEAMYQHVSGKGYTAFINTAGGASSTGNQVVGTVGIRTRF
jgi:predicted porin